MRILISFVTSILLIGVLQAQEIKDNPINPSFQLNYLYGDVKNPIDIPNQNNAHFVQLSVMNQTGLYPESYLSLYKKPEIGFTALYGYLGKKDVLGSVLSVYPTWQYTFFSDKSIGGNIKLGSGFAYFTTPYNKISNPDNLLIGSHISNITEISPNIWFKFAPGAFVQTGVSFLHFSNGHTSIPNIGLNDVTVKLGVIYRPGSLVGLETKKRVAIKPDSIWRKSIAIALGRHELAYSTYPVDGPTYNIYKVSGYVTKQFRTIHEFQLGFSVAFFDSYYSFIKYEDYYKHFKPVLSTQTSLHIGHEFLLQKFGFVTELGIKILDPFYRDEFMKNEVGFNQFTKNYLSSRVGFKYYPFTKAFAGEKIAIGMFIKTNFAQADFVEYNLSYTF